MILLRRHVFITVLGTVLLLFWGYMVLQDARFISTFRWKEVGEEGDLPRRTTLGLAAEYADCVAPLGGKTQPDAAEKFFTDLKARFRLAGFRLSIKKNGKSSAIIEDNVDGTQWMRRAGDRLTASIVIETVGTNSVTLTTPYGLYVLYQSKKGEIAKGQVMGGGTDVRAGIVSGAVSKLFGKEDSPGTWTFQRRDMMDYFEEIKERPERLEAVFDTLAPIWYTDEADGKQKIEGYRVEICGEEEFFKAVGFQEGDIVREVNGIRMTNRYAAEELIRRFVKNDLTFAHIKMERGGEEILQTYLIEQ